MSSACIHRKITTGRGKRSRHTSARLTPVAMPSFALIDWMSIAIRLAAEDDPQQHVAELRAAGHVGREVAGVDVRDRGDEGRTEEREQRAQAAPLAVERALGRPQDALLAREGDCSDVRAPAAASTRRRRRSGRPQRPLGATSSTNIAAGQPERDADAAALDPDLDRALELALGHDLDARARQQAAALELAKAAGVVVRHALHDDLLARAAFAEGTVARASATLPARVGMAWP